MKKLSSALLVLCIFFQLTACSSTTLIRASDPAAKISINGNYRGTGTATYSDTKIIGATNTVKLQKDGCMPQTYTFSRNESFQVGPCIGGVFLFFPFLWIMGYDSEHGFDYQCQPQAATAPTSSR